MVYIPIGISLQSRGLTKGISFFLLTCGFIAQIVFSLVDTSFMFGRTIELVLEVATAVGLFELIRMLELRNSFCWSNMRKISTVMYFTHMYIWTGYYMLVYKTKTYGWDSFLITTGISMLVAVLYLMIKKKELRIFCKSC